MDTSQGYVIIYMFFPYNELTVYCSVFHCNTFIECFVLEAGKLALKFVKQTKQEREDDSERGDDSEIEEAQVNIRYEDGRDRYEGKKID